MCNNIANKLRIARLSRGYSQEAVAYELGISQVAYSKFENGKTKITLGRLKQISEVLDISFIDLLVDYD